MPGAWSVYVLDADRPAVLDAGDHGDDVDAIVPELDQRWRSPTVQRDVAGVLQWLDRG